MKSQKNERGFAGVEAVLIVVVVGLVVGLGWYIWSKNKSNDTTPATTATSTTTTTPVAKSVYDGWKVYYSKEEKSYFKYPSDWTYTTDSNSGITTFKSPTGSEVWWQPAIGGLGGNCDPNTDPHIFFTTVSEVTNTPGFYAVETGSSATNSTGIFLDNESSKPKVGDAGCLVYPYFTPKYSTFNGDLESAGLGSTYNKASVADKATIKNILLSYHY